MNNRILLLKAVIALCVFIFSASSAMAFGRIDFSIGETTEAMFAASIASSNGNNYGTFSFTPLISMSGDIAGPDADQNIASWELKGSMKARVTSMPLDACMVPDTIYLRAWLGSAISITAGYYSENGLAAEFFSQTAFFGPVSPLSFLESGGNTRTQNKEMLAKVGISNDTWRASFTMAPFEPLAALPSLESFWFPDTDIPRSVHIDDQVYTMASLNYSAGISEYPFKPGLSYEIVGGVSSSSFDLDLAYFHGLERQAVLSAKISQMPTSDSYDLEITPHRAIIDSMAATITFIADVFRYWIEASYTFGASVASGSLEFAGIYMDNKTFSVTKTPPVLNADRFGMTIGASWRGSIGRLPIDIAAEAVWTHFFSEEKLNASPLLSKALVISGAMRNEVGRFGASCSMMISLLDGSAALRPAASLAFGGDNSAELAFPLFFGAVGTELGRYSDHRFAFLTLVHRY